MVVFATPGMLHGGLSLEIFKKWCTSEKNTIIMPGYCVAGTVGNKILSGMRKIELQPGKVCWLFGTGRISCLGMSMETSCFRLLK